MTNKFNTIHSIDFAGAVDKSNILDLKKWKKVSLSYSFTYLFNPIYSFKNSPRGIPKHKPFDNEYKEMYDALEKQFIINYNQTLTNPLSALNHPEFYDAEELKKAWLDSVAKYEKILTKNSWTAKTFIWIKATAGILSFDNADYIVKGDFLTYGSPKSEITYTPSVMLSGNYYYGLQSGLSFYASIFVQGAVKNTFSEVMTTSAWTNINPLTSSTQLTLGTKDVYMLTVDNIEKKFLANIGAEGIIFFPSFKYFGLGIHISTAYNGLISDNPVKSLGWLQNLQSGLVISFKDKTGASTINLEPYYQNKKYVDFNLPRQEFWGIKFSLPINRLF